MSVKELRERISGLILPVLFLTATFGLFGPVSLYLANADEFWFGLGDVLPICLACTVIAFAVLLGIGALLKKSAAQWYVCLMIGLALALYVQGNYVTVDYGTLDGTSIDWSAYGWTAIWDTVLWLICIAAPFAVKLLLPKVWESAQKYACLALVGVQLLAIVMTMITGLSGNENEDYSLTNYGRFELSGKDNTIIFILDCYDSQAFGDLIDVNPELKEELFRDFVYYPDTAGGATRTVLALPYILTGKPYITENGYENYVRDGFSSAQLYDALDKNNYNVGIYTNSDYVSPEMWDLVVNFSGESKKVDSYPTLAYYLYKFTACRYYPHILKESVWMYSGDFDEAADQSGSGEAVYIIDDARFYESLKSDGITLQHETNAFRVYHLMGAHYPYTLNKNSQREPNGVSSQEQQLGVMNILSAYFDEMKALGIYENANIIVMADHGEKNYEQNPLLLIKQGSQVSQYTVSDLRVSYANLHPTLLEMIGHRSDGISISQLTEQDNACRMFYKQNGSSIIEFQITGHASDPQSVTETGNAYSMLDLTSSAEYELGTELFFDNRATGNRYIIDGVRGIENTHTWTLGHETNLKIPLKEIPDHDLFVSIALYAKITNRQRVGVYIGETELGYYMVTGNSLDFIIPVNILKDPEIKLCLKLPDAISPAEINNLSGDHSILSLGLKAMVIREVQEADTETLKIADCELGTEIYFDSRNTADGYIISGLRGAETTHTWTVGYETILAFPLKEQPKQDLFCSFSMINMITDYQRAGVYVNGNLIGWFLPSNNTLSFIIPSESFTDSELYLELILPDAASSAELRGDPSLDPTVLGLAIKSVIIRDVQTGDDDLITQMIPAP